MIARAKKPDLELLEVSHLTVDPRYQRAEDEKRVKRMAANFSWALFGVLETSKRGNGSYAVFDGQHRRALAELLEIQIVPCLVHRDLTPEQESELFTLLQTQRKGLSQTDRFRAQVFSGNPESVEIDRIVAESGFAIDKRRHAPESISAVTVVEGIYRRYGGEHLGRELVEIKSLWQGEEGSLQGAFLGGFARFLAAYGDDRYNEEVRERLQAVSPMIVMRRASVVRGGGEQIHLLVYRQLQKVAKMRGAPKKL